MFRFDEMHYDCDFLINNKYEKRKKNRFGFMFSHRSLATPFDFYRYTHAERL